MPIKFKESNCPNCRGHIPMAWITMWAWCPECKQIWRVKQTQRETKWWYPKPVLVVGVKGGNTRTS